MSSNVRTEILDLCEKMRSPFFWDGMRELWQAGRQHYETAKLLAKPLPSGIIESSVLPGDEPLEVTAERERLMAEDCRKWFDLDYVAPLKRLRSLLEEHFPAAIAEMPADFRVFPQAVTIAGQTETRILGSAELAERMIRVHAAVLAAAKPAAVADAVGVAGVNAEDSGLFTTGELARLAGVSMKTLRNRMSNSRSSDDGSNLPAEAAVKGSGQQPDSYRYSAIRPWLLATWPMREIYFPTDPIKARQILANCAD